MGTKTPTNKPKREIACELCDIKFQTVQARNTHVSFKHSLTKESDSSSGNAAVPSILTSRVSKRLQLKKGSTDDGNKTQEMKQKIDFKSIHDSEQSLVTKQKIDFECPKCPKVFPIYFQAVKHIQKKHCEDNLGNPVSPESLDLIKPLQVITRAPSIPITNVSTANQKKLSETDTYFCLGCDGQFASIALFNIHLTLNHLENVDSMFFKTPEEFDVWKKKMEMQVRIKYLPLSKYNTKKFYQCNYVSPKNEFTKTYLCPSSINTKEMHGGVQIHYRKNHCDHITPKYVVPKEFANHTLKRKSAKDPFDELLNQENIPTIKEDLYTKFKNLMLIITNEAKNAEEDVLKTLFDSALKMRAALCDDDDDTEEFISKSMTDDQITNALEGKRSLRNKRKISIVSTNAKKAKVNDATKETISKENNKSKVKDEGKKEAKESNKSGDDKNKTVSKENNESPEIRPKPPSSVLSPSFNDTYKQFLGVEETEQVTKPKNRNTKRKEVVKTKMGQFSPKKKLSIEADKSPPNILKPSRTNTSLFSKDVKYEVREQENDCNILILKI